MLLGKQWWEEIIKDSIVRLFRRGRGLRVRSFWAVTGWCLFYRFLRVAIWLFAVPVTLFVNTWVYLRFCWWFRCGLWVAGELGLLFRPVCFWECWQFLVDLVVVLYWVCLCFWRGGCCADLTCWVVCVDRWVLRRVINLSGLVLPLNFGSWSVVLIVWWWVVRLGGGLMVLLFLWARGGVVVIGWRIIGWSVIIRWFRVTVCRLGVVRVVRRLPVLRLLVWWGLFLVARRVVFFPSGFLLVIWCTIVFVGSWCASLVVRFAVVVVRVAVVIVRVAVVVAVRWFLVVLLGCFVSFVPSCVFRVNFVVVRMRVVVVLLFVRVPAWSVYLVLSAVDVPMWLYLVLWLTFLFLVGTGFLFRAMLDL